MKRLTLPLALSFGMSMAVLAPPVPDFPAPLTTTPLLRLVSFPPPHGVRAGTATRAIGAPPLRRGRMGLRYRTVPPRYGRPKL